MPRPLPAAAGGGKTPALVGEEMCTLAPSATTLSWQRWASQLLPRKPSRPQYFPVMTHLEMVFPEAQWTSPCWGSPETSQKA